MNLGKFNHRMSELEAQLGIAKACYCWPPRPGGGICPDGEILDYGLCPRCGGKGPAIPLPYCPRQKLIDQIESIARRAGIDHEITETTHDMDAQSVYESLVAFIYRDDRIRTY
jgi:hypothetical protein